MHDRTRGRRWSPPRMMTAPFFYRHGRGRGRSSGGTEAPPPSSLIHKRGAASRERFKGLD